MHEPQPGTTVFKVVREKPDGSLVSPKVSGPWQVVYQPGAFVCAPDPHAMLFAYRSERQAFLMSRYLVLDAHDDLKFQLWRATTTKVIEDYPQWVPIPTEQQYFLAYWQGQYYREKTTQRENLMPAYLTVLVEHDAVLCTDLRLDVRLA